RSGRQRTLLASQTQRARRRKPPAVCWRQTKPPLPRRKAPRSRPSCWPRWRASSRRLTSCWRRRKMPWLRRRQLPPPASPSWRPSWPRLPDPWPPPRPPPARGRPRRPSVSLRWRASC
ncbi:unnamed protein product, partial [Ectocarpus sp. 12 AP-2014]